MERLSEVNVSADKGQVPPPNPFNNMDTQLAAMVLEELHGAFDPLRDDASRANQTSGTTDGAK